MKSSQKAAISLLITILLFGGFTVLAFTGLFDVIEARFYNPTIAASINREITRNAAIIDEFVTDTKFHFSQTLREPAVQRSFLLNQSAEDILERSRIYGFLRESVGGFQWVRFIDAEGARIHFSTYAGDILTQGPQFITFRNFNEPNFPYEAIAAESGEGSRLILDSEGDRIFFSFPIYDHFDIYRGTALFSLSARALSDLFIREGRLSVGHNISVVSNPPGFLSGTPAVFAEENLISQVASIWREGVLNVARLHSAESGVSLTLLSLRSPQGFFVGRLVNDELFLFPQTMRILLLLSFFFTVYLTVFLFFNLRQDSVTIIQDRMKKLQFSLIEQYYESKSEIDWNRWSWELEQRRGEINAQLKRGVKIASDKKAKDIDVIIDKSWDELLSVIGGVKETAIDENKLQLLLNRLVAAIPNAAIPPRISAQSVSAAPADVPVVDASSAKGSSSEVQIVEELENLESVEELEELEEIELVEDAENIESLTETEATEIIDDLEEIEAAEDVEDEDDVTEIEVAQAIKEIESAKATELVEELEEVEPIEELLEEVETVEEVEELEEENATASPVNSPPQLDVAHIASEIEFNGTTQTESSNEKEIPWDDFEIVSPFDAFSNLSALDDEDTPEEESAAETESGASPSEITAEVETEDKDSLPETSAEAGELFPLSGDKKKSLLNNQFADINQGYTLTTKAFFNVVANIETLEALPDDSEERVDFDHTGIIKEREGVPYINEDALKSGDTTEPDLNQDFKTLVDSVMK